MNETCFTHTDANLKYVIGTFGCQMNERDSELLSGMLEEMGYSKGEDFEHADLIILNTCCVRETAENKILGRIGELKALKEKNPDLIIGVCGCMVQQPEMAAKLKKRAPHIELIFGTHNIHKLPDMIHEIKTSRKTVIDVWESEGEIVEGIPFKRTDGVRANVTIMYGCNNFCTYCIVPYVRGRERSRLPEDIVKEVTDAVNNGFKEVMLLGQNVNSYGKGLEEKIDFAYLLEQLDKIEGLERIRYMTSHPRDFNDRLIDVIATSKKVCNSFHLPVQAGGNNVLHRMNRGYTKEQYLELVNKIRTKVPDASISTDLIVGFPGETEEDFNETLDLLEKVQFDAAFTFVYNKRSGTPAATMEDQVPDKVKKERIQKLIALQNNISHENNLKEVGKEYKILIEGFKADQPEVQEGKTETGKTVLIKSKEDLTGQLVKVRIVESGTWHLNGILI